MGLINIAYATSLRPVTTNQTLDSLFSYAMRDFIIPILSAAAIGAVIYSGLLFISSQGDPEKIKTARATLTWAIIGILVIVLSYAVVVYLNRFINS